MRFGVFVAATVATSAWSASGLATNPQNLVIVSVEDDYGLEYEWEYINDPVKPYLEMDIILADVNVGSASSSIHGVALAVVSKDATPDSRNGFLNMQASRWLLLSIDYPNGAPQVTSVRTTFDFCTSSSECSRQSGWGRPQSKAQQAIIRSNQCLTEGFEVKSITSSKSGARQGMTIRVKMDADAFQKCSTRLDTADNFRINFEAGAVTKFVYGIWTGTSLSSFTDSDPFSSAAHNYVWLDGQPQDLTLTVGTPTKAPTKRPTFMPTKSPSKRPTRMPTKSPTGKPTKSPTPKPTPRPTTAIPTKSPTTGIPTKSPTQKPTRGPTTAKPTKSPTTGVPSKSPTNRPTKNPTKSPTGRPTRNPTPRPTGRPTDSPTDRPTRGPTPKPTPRPTRPLVCPNDMHYIKCSNVNSMYKHLANDPERRAANIARECRKSRFSRDCTWCESGKDSFTGCRPRRDGNGGLQHEPSVCAPQADPFSTLGCKMFSECPRPALMSGCGHVNTLRNDERWRLKKICTGAFEHQGHQIEKNECIWCNGVCRAAAPYQSLSEVICKTPGLFDEIKKCPTL